MQTPTKQLICERCKGTGKVKYLQKTKPCVKCRGTGRTTGYVTK